MKRKEVVSPLAAPHLAERIDQLSIKRQEIIRPILEHPREYVLLSVRAMAARLQTDPATIVRIVRGLGFGSYREFQRHLHELSLAFATSLDTMQSGARDGSMPSHVRDSLERDLKNVQGLINSLDAQRLVALARRFYDARRIVLLAGDLAVYLAHYFEYQVSVLGLPIFSATSAGRILHLVRGVNKQDLVIAISFRRGLR
jgi:DNA-binding MurR/RpiR family transcriptional regulator